MLRGWCAGRDERGATLLELLVGLAVGVFVLAAALGALAGLGRLVSVEWLLLRQQEQSNVLAPLLVNWLAGAGCGREDRAAAVQIAEDRIRVEADIDGPEGFPDGRLEDGFELLSLAAGRGSLRVKSRGGASQPAADTIESVAFAQPLPQLLRVDLHLGGPDGSPERRLELWIRLPNLAPDGLAGRAGRGTP